MLPACSGIGQHSSIFVLIQQQYQQSLLSQTSWSRLEMKPKKHKGHGSVTLIASLQALLSKVNSSEISQSLRSLLTDSSQFSLCLHLPLFILSTRFSTPLHTGASRGLHWTCSNHLNRCWVSFSSFGATLTLFRIALFQTLFLLVCPQNHRNIRISATLRTAMRDDRKKHCSTCSSFV